MFLLNLARTPVAWSARACILPYGHFILWSLSVSMPVGSYKPARFFLSTLRAKFSLFPDFHRNLLTVSI